MLIYLGIFLLGYVVGGVLWAYLMTKILNEKPCGTLKMDRSTGDPYLFLELSVPVEKLLKMDSVVLKVDPTDIARR